MGTIDAADRAAYAIATLASLKHGAGLAIAGDATVRACIVAEADRETWRRAALADTRGATPAQAARHHGETIFAAIEASAVCAALSADALWVEAHGEVVNTKVRWMPHHSAGAHERWTATRAVRAIPGPAPLGMALEPCSLNDTFAALARDVAEWTAMWPDTQRSTIVCWTREGSSMPISRGWRESTGRTTIVGEGLSYLALMQAVFDAEDEKNK